MPPIFEQVTAWVVSFVHFCESGANCNGEVPKVVGCIVVYKRWRYGPANFVPDIGQDMVNCGAVRAAGIW